MAIIRGDGPWTHRVIVGGNSTDCNWKSYKVRVMKTAKLIAHNTRHMQKMPIMTKQYLSKL